MYIAKFALITLVAFALLTGCAMIGQEAEMAEETEMTTGEKPMEKTTDKPMYQEVTFQVEGMTWGSCPAIVRSALSKVTGVEVISVSRETKLVVVKVPKGKVTNETLIKTIDDADARFTASVAN